MDVLQSIGCRYTTIRNSIRCIFNKTFLLLKSIEFHIITIPIIILEATRVIILKVRRLIVYLHITDLNI